MRYMIFGWPVVSLVVAIGGIAMLLRAAQLMARSRMAAAILSSFGRAALPILFLHMGFMVVFGQLPEPVTYLAALVGPYLAWLLMTRFRATRVLFLGQGEPPAWLAGRR
jgi:fucose 4-O-acetylase-like acetyltransferase